MTDGRYANMAGIVGDVQVLRPIGFGFDDAAVETAKTWTFKPALKMEPGE